MSVDKNEKRKEKLCFAPTKQGALQILHPGWSVFISNLLCLPRAPHKEIKVLEFQTCRPYCLCTEYSAVERLVDRDDVGNGVGRCGDGISSFAPELLKALEYREE
ncbi:hypothetical protein CBL_07291 [Carabus blaptoides fortunei]